MKPKPEFVMSAIGPKRTCASAVQDSDIGSKADMGSCTALSASARSGHSLLHRTCFRG